MQTFEEKFPGLIAVDTMCSAYRCLCPKCSLNFLAEWKELSAHEPYNYSGGVLVSKEGEDLISKKRVLEAIEKVSSHGSYCKCPVRFNDYAKEALLRELRLECKDKIGGDE